MDMQTIWNENRVILRGTAAAEPVKIGFFTVGFLLILIGCFYSIETTYAI